MLLITLFTDAEENPFQQNRKIMEKEFVHGQSPAVEQTLRFSRFERNGQDSLHLMSTGRFSK